MPGYEYLWVSRYEGKLNEAGADGWHVVPGILDDDGPDGFPLLMQREIPDTDTPAARAQAPSEREARLEALLRRLYRSGGLPEGWLNEINQEIGL